MITKTLNYPSSTISAIHDPIYGGFWCRATAAAVDGAIIAIIMSVVGMFFSFGFEDLAGIMTLFGGTSAASEDAILSALMSLAYRLALLVFVSFVLTWLYSAGFEASKFQATPGKIYMGIYVATAEGEKISFLRATVRHFAKNLSLILLGVGYFIQPLTKLHQALHDLIANCVVLETKSVGLPQYLLATLFSIVAPIFVSIIVMAIGVIV